MLNIVLTLVALVASPAVGIVQSAEEQAVRETLNQYFRGHATGDAAGMRKAFLPTAHVEGLRSGRFVSWTVDEYCANFKGQPAADE